MAVMLCGASGAWAAVSSPYFTALSASGDTELQTGRYGPMSAELPSGQVLIAGGFNEVDDFLRSAELFNPASDTFTALPASGATEMHTIRAYGVAALLPDGMVLVAGGYAGSVTQSAELFNPVGDTFTALPASGATELQTARKNAMAAPLPNGQVLIAGGESKEEHVLQSAELFYPVGDTFTTLPASGATELQTARESAVAAALPDGQVLIAGGYDGSSDPQSAELFNPVSDTFTALPASGATELQAARPEAMAAPLASGQVLIAGGYAGAYLRSAELFNPASDTFTALPAFDATELQTARASGVAAPLPNGQVLITGGVNSLEEPQSAELFYSAAQAAAAGADFGDQTVGAPSPTSALVVTNVGAQELAIAGVSLGGADPSDFAITADACAGQTLAFKQSCTITVRFTPAATGAREATVALSDNEPSPTAIALSGTGVAANPGPVVIVAPTHMAPSLSSLSETAKTWREGNALAHISSKKRTTKKLPLGTTFSFALNEPASVTFMFTEPANGRKLGKRCVAQTAKNKHKPRCTRTLTAGTITFSAHAGTNKVHFEGLISKHTKLKPGSYTLLVTATASGKRSTTETLKFTIASG